MVLHERISGIWFPPPPPKKKKKKKKKQQQQQQQHSGNRTILADPRSHLTTASQNSHDHLNLASGATSVGGLHMIFMPKCFLKEIHILFLLQSV